MFRLLQMYLFLLQRLPIDAKLITTNTQSIIDVQDKVTNLLLKIKGNLNIKIYITLNIQINILLALQIIIEIIIVPSCVYNAIC